MASTRRRGAHAAAGPKPAVGGSAPGSGGARGTGSMGGPRGTGSMGGPRGTGGTGGSRGLGDAARTALTRLRARLSPKRLVVAVLVLGFATVLFTGGLWSSPSAEPTVQQFLLNWQQHSYAAAAALTTGDVAQVKNELAKAYSRLDAAAFYLSMGKIHQSGATATAHFTASVDLGQDGAPWMYDGRFTLRRVGPGWKIVWSPSVINPGLGPGLRLAVISTTRHRMPVLDAEGQPLQTPSTAFVVGVRPYRLKDPAATADALGRATGIEPFEVLGWILAAPRKQFLELVTFRPAEFHRLAHQLKKVPGLITRHRRVLLFHSIAPEVVGSVGAEASTALRDAGIAYRPGTTVGLSGLQSRYQSYLAGTPTTEVVAETASGRTVRVLKTWSGRAPASVHTTIDARVQEAAMRAVAAAPGSAAIVAMRASSPWPATRPTGCRRSTRWPAVTRPGGPSPSCPPQRCWPTAWRRTTPSPATRSTRSAGTTSATCRRRPRTRARRSRPTSRNHASPRSAGCPRG